NGSNTKLVVGHSIARGQLRNIGFTLGFGSTKADRRWGRVTTRTRADWRTEVIVLAAVASTAVTITPAVAAARVEGSKNSLGGGLLAFPIPQFLWNLIQEPGWREIVG